MSFRPEAVRGTAGVPGDGSAAVVDYRLARQQVISQFQKGRLSRHDVCDAHPELRRAAAGVGQPVSEPCPICEEGVLTLVTYAFGPRLPAGGRCISTAKELARLDRGRRSVACYVVEVCATCAWNHLIKVFRVGGS